MTIDRSRERLVDRITGGLAVPRFAKLGAVVIALGLVGDLLEHTVVEHVHDELVGAFPLGEHAAHLVVLVGMVLVLAGIVADGIRSQRRSIRQEGITPDAIR